VNPVLILALGRYWREAISYLLQPLLLHRHLADDLEALLADDHASFSDATLGIAIFTCSQSPWSRRISLHY
jgi:hypothetical protein